MTPDEKFSRWVKIAALSFLILFGYFLIADNTMPLTPHAMVTRTVTKVAPQVSGPVSALAVDNNQDVHQGDVLFRIESAPYRIAVDQAKLALAQARQSNAQLDASLMAARQDVSALASVLAQKAREAKRLKALFAKNGVSQQQRDDAISATDTARAKWEAAKARVSALQIQRGGDGASNIAEQVALSKLKKAQLNQSYTIVKASHDGVVTNLQLDVGAYASAGQPIMALVSERAQLIADFREKSVRDIEAGYTALVAFDSEPGALYAGHVTSVDAGVSAGQIDANGQLASPTNSNRWVRDAQRMRLHIQLDEWPSHALPTGARATVQLVPDHAISCLLAKAQVGFLSMLHYIY
ncbi:hemolysin D [Salinivibrio sp. MA440]|uniref:HlyD family secretion protein n=1 Tax=Salinivibrio sp. MA440 TaxID=1909456 RepID=UPI000988C157|nr:HlyD family secretion protein [Salinivibrio sp. MA440]OOF01784.1 hemolysin D [Salinivibrio sp. MA440]